MWVKCVLVWYSQPLTSTFGLVNRSIKKMSLECRLHPSHSMVKRVYVLYNFFIYFLSLTWLSRNDVSMNGMSSSRRSSLFKSLSRLSFNFSDRGKSSSANLLSKSFEFSRSWFNTIYHIKGLRIIYVSRIVTSTFV